MPSITKSSFERPRFTPLPPKSGTEDEAETITSLPDLIEFNARHNPDHIFCIQARSSSGSLEAAGSHNAAFEPCPITFAQLDSAVHACACAITNLVPRNQDSVDRQTSEPLALYLESDAGLFFHLAALMTLHLPVWLNKTVKRGSNT